MDVDTPASGLILIEYDETKECDADKDEGYKSDKESENTDEDGRPTKKRKRDVILSR
jgi:hypothetical protein